MTGFPRRAVETGIPERFETVAREDPRRPAIEWEGSVWSFEELNARANRLARHLLRDGPPMGPTLLLLGHGADEIAGMLASAKARSAYVALDPAAPSAHLQAIARDVGAARIVSHRRYREIASQLADDLIEVENLDPTLSRANLDISGSAGDLATIVYTSGSTGEPKGVMRSHRCVLHRSWLFGESLEVARGDRISHMFSCSFAAAEVDVYGALLHGATLVIYPTKESGIGPLADWLLREQIHFLHPPPTLFRRFLDGLDRPLESTALRVVSLAGEAVFRIDLERIRRLLPGCTLVHRFSATETSVVARLILAPDTPVDDAILPAGHFVPDKRVRLVDAAGNAVADGEIGEIEVSSRYLSDGYWRRPELTRERFRVAPDGKSRIVRTGDLGCIRPDGMLQHRGRADRQVKVRGYRVEPEQIECALLELDGVAEAAVLMKSDDRGEARLSAFVVSADRESRDEVGLRRRLARRLPSYMIPSHIAFIEELPATSTGKVDRRALARRAEEARPIPLARSAPDARDGLEFQLRLLWHDVMERREIGNHDDFFELGGDSIQLADLMVRVERLFGESPSIADFVAEPTIAAMARRLRGKRPTAAFRYLVPMRTGGDKAPFFCVHAMSGSVMHFVHLARHFEPDRPFFGIQARGMDGCGTPHASIEAMASDYLVEVRRQQPFGPYFLGGRCLGALVATEMARRLLASGEPVAIVAVFDTFAPRAARLAERAKKRWKRLRRRLHRAVAAPAPDAAESFERRMKRLRKRYRPDPYPGDLTLFSIGTEREIQARRWRDFARGHVEIETIPGDHLTIFREPHVQTLARHLEARLAHASAGREREAERG